jgi:hypothetical protein
MNFSKLGKQQKQYIVLGALCTAGILVGGVMGIRFSLSSVSKAKEELAALTDKIERAESTLSRGKNAGEEFVRTLGILETQLSNMPPDKNYYSWATEAVYGVARNSGFEIDSVDEFNLASTKEDAAKDGLRFRSYSIRIMAHGSYANARNFLATIEEQHPMARLSGLEISAGANPDAHDVQLYVQWPFDFSELLLVWEGVQRNQRAVAVNIPQLAAGTKPEPEPVVAAVEPEPEPAPVVVATPKPVVEAPVIVPEPEPVVAAVEPEPEPAPVIEAPVIASTPAAKEPRQDLDAMVSIMESIDTYEANRPRSEEEKMKDVLASLEARGETGTQPAPVPTDEPDAASLEALVAQLEQEPGLAEQLLQAEVPAEPVQEVAPRSDGPKYATTSKSAKKLTALLRKDKPKESDSLGSFLDGLMEDINEKN